MHYHCATEAVKVVPMSKILFISSGMEIRGSDLKPREGSGILMCIKHNHLRLRKIPSLADIFLVVYSNHSKSRTFFQTLLYLQLLKYTNFGLHCFVQ